MTDSEEELEPDVIDVHGTVAPTPSSFRGRATYSPEDDKLRLYPFSEEQWPVGVYDIYKSLGMGWAHLQKCMHCHWSPEREDQFLEWGGGDIEDEDVTLEERAEARNDRYQGYEGRWLQESTERLQRVQHLLAGKEFGQPILIAHHSEKKARSDAKKIENNSRRAVDAFRTAEYWDWRAGGVIAHAQRRDRADVVARRIKKLEADLRKREANASDRYCLTLTRNFIDHHKTEYEHQLVMSQYRNEAPPPTLDLAALTQRAATALDQMLERNQRWIDHLQLRIRYERMIYQAQTGVDLHDLKSALVKGGQIWCNQHWAIIQRVNKSADGVASVTVLNLRRASWQSSQSIVDVDIIKYVRTPDQIEGDEFPADWLEEWKSKLKAETGRDFDADDIPVEGKGEWVADVKLHKAVSVGARMNQHMLALAEAVAKTGVEIAVVDQLVETPPAIVKMIIGKVDDYIGGYRVPKIRLLEIGAGRGALLRPLRETFNGPRVVIDYCELEPRLWPDLERVLGTQRVADDFLKYRPRQLYHFVIGNPPFRNHLDLLHLEHATRLLAKGGVAIMVMSRGSATSDKFKDLFGGGERGYMAARREFSVFDNIRLPDDTFNYQESGVTVFANLVKVHRRE